MRRLFRWLIGAHAANAGERVPSSSEQMTLHDALRLCAGQVQNDDRAATNKTPRPAVLLLRRQLQRSFEGRSGRNL